MDGLWPKECASDDHQALHLLACLSCSEDQPKFTDRKKQVVRVCESVLKDIYGAQDLTKPTDAYEKCGAWSSPDTIITKIGATWEDGYVMSTPDPVLIYPLTTYKNAEEFFSNFPPISIPFMEDFKIQAVPDENEKGEPNVCFKSAQLNAVVSISSLVVLTASYMLF